MAFLFALLTRDRYGVIYVLVAIGALVAVMASYFLLAMSLRCPRCRRRVLVQTVSKPPYGEPSRNINAWERVVVRIVFDGQFRCMYCGQHYSVRNPAIEAQ